jgi:hypothetical protein
MASETDKPPSVGYGRGLFHHNSAGLVSARAAGAAWTAPIFILWKGSLCDQLEAFRRVLEEGVATEDVDVALGCGYDRLHTATHHPAHHPAAAKAALSAWEATAARSALSTWEATASGSALSTREATTTGSTLATKAWSSALLSSLTLLR